MFLTLGFTLLLSLALLVVYFLTYFPSAAAQTEKGSPFECGFEPLSDMRSPFSVRFFILVVLFLIFDIEIALLFPVLSMIMVTSRPLLSWGVVFFLLVLIAGLFHEWNEGSLDWVSS
uniref:NADH-ubiquinone oxidoreductase chain 3 n=1 Tax=Pyramidella dolabrata TaxID=252582 RepID=B3DFG5_9GAST|nr:NADH dehydrogenase subunit 3 [Pyramidella dolabrata]ACE62852.1 NADH dehydrogenase subunit 3 [Pyramidella dolabrata]